MARKVSGMISFDEAIALLSGAIAPLGSETLPLTEAAGRFLSGDLSARCDAPRRDVSAMDGYAVAIGTVENGAPMRVAGESRAGMPFDGSIAGGEAVRIFTGAALPEGADCVIMQEYATREGQLVRFAEGHGPARHVRLAGSDFREGDKLLAKGARLTPPAMVSAAAADRATLDVGKRPEVAIVATGDELVAPGKAHESAHTMPETASHGVAALCRAMDGEVVASVHGRDTLGELEELAAKALAAADCVVVIGGASVGDHDLARPMFAAHEMELVFSRIAIKPGKPVWLGKVGEKPVLGLPGNPTSAMVTARLFLRPLLAAMQGGSVKGELRFAPLPLAASVEASGSRETFLRAEMTEEGLVLVSNQQSGAQHPLARADRLIRRPAGSNAASAGELVSAIDL
ncbi:molybdopterin molybdotransferase MoeA [Qipengyuania aquimaris]|uniref:molybdopterin molybdotransferase MoeA n=1 Tax=Qipengyuania aquimaris TaxID=255984 RepID=UPI001FD13EF8|nr:molybdopterin molybdotransferase MoeA [Qipengyuania aquimaris]UOR15819.1 molybdopterin molybdotransferase MoeA [Qipengyuania aquimaris]